MRYSDYTVEQLREEFAKMKEQSQKAEQLGNVQELMILERKMQMVASYLLNPEDFKPDEVYDIQGDPGYKFKISYVDGVMAWGYRINLLGNEEEKQSALPLSMLYEK